MRRILILVTVLMCSLGVADEAQVEKQPRVLPLQVEGLVSADQAELAEEQGKAQATAEAAREALDKLLNGVQVQPEGSEAAAQKAPISRTEVMRDEPSVAVIPTAHMPAKAYTKFAALRDKLKSTEDVIVLVQELAKFVDGYPQHREARITLGRLQILLDEAENALSTFAPLMLPAFANSHPDWQPWFWAGTAHLALGNLERARANLDIAVSKEGAVVDIWVQLAVLEQELNNHAGALQYIAIAEQLDPRAASIYLNRAYSLEQLGRFEEALSAYQRFLISDMNGASKALRPAILRRIATIAAAVAPDEATVGRSS